MRIMIVDDERRARSMLETILRELGEEEIVSFGSAAEALDHVRQANCDLSFLDVEMPQVNGMGLAAALTKLPCPPVIAFVTAYPQYALQAWDAEAVDYILKPYDAERIRRTLERAGRLLAGAAETPRVAVRCFPSFGLWVDGVPVDFGSRKARELLAFLVHMQGEWVGIDSVIFALFEDSGEHSSKNYYRQVLYRLKRTLSEAAVPDLVESAYGKVRVNPAQFTCDYYRYLKGEKGLFFGEYLSDYSWAEPTLADLRQKG